jgi:hypothetical protein
MQSLALKVSGLHTSPNQYSEVPDGALLEATDIAINQASVAEPRRGFDRLSATTGDVPNVLWFYKSTLHAHVGMATVKAYSGGSWSTIAGTFTPISGARVRVAEANQNCYFTTASGVYKLSAAGGAATLAGVPKGIDVTGSTTATASGFLADSKAVAYRVVWGIRDANGNVVLGAPSQREVVTSPSSGGPHRVDLAISIPAGITTSHFYQVYRSKTENSGTEPSDELQLVYEENPTSGEISALTLTVQDITPEALRGATIYTAQSQEGLTAGNERPPLCRDLAVFKDTTFFGNVTNPQRLTLTLLSVGLSTNNSLDDGDTVTVAGTTFTAKTSPSAGTDFQITTSGSAAQNIRATALALIKKINSQSSTVYAYYLSGTSDLPGKILIEARTLGASVFSVSVSSGAAGAFTGVGDSSADAFLNGVYYSKPSQPEHVPLPNFFQVGSKDKAILRLIPLQDSLFVFKEDGIYRISEAGGAGFTVQGFDFSSKLLAGESPAVLNNQIYAFTDQGVVTVTDTGVSVISRPIERELIRAQSLAASVIRTTSFGVSYEQDRKYLLFVPEASTDTGPSAAYVYDSFTGTWVRWALPRRCGVVGSVDVRDSSSKDLLYLGEQSAAYVRIERKNLAYTDYADYVQDVTVSAASGTSVTLASGGDLVNVGDVIYQSATVWAHVTARTSNVLTMDVDAGFSAAAATHLAAIPARIQWAPSSFQNPGSLKQFHECTFLFRREYGGAARAEFSTDLSTGEEGVDINGTGNGLWGLFTWSDEAIWGGEQFRRPVRVWIPREKQVGSYLKFAFEHSWAFEGFELEGVSLFAKSIGSGRVRR